MRTPKPISSVITFVIQELGIGLKIKQHEVLDAWSRIVGEQIARVTTAERLNDGKLFISVTRSTWRNELVFLKKELIEKIGRSGKFIVREVAEQKRVVFRSRELSRRNIARRRELRMKHRDAVIGVAQVAGL